MKDDDIILESDFLRDSKVLSEVRIKLKKKDKARFRVYDVYTS